MLEELILSREEVAGLTGYQRPSKQNEWLRDAGIMHWIVADGHPRVPRDALKSQEPRRREPDFSALG
jgi:hypothetical protein